MILRARHLRNRGVKDFELDTVSRLGGVLDRLLAYNDIESAGLVL
jgi:hypothetical protein